MIRLAKEEDMETILNIYQTARQYMRDNGNAGQWGDSHPPRAQLEEDIRRRQLYVEEQGGCVHGVFAFVLGEDPTYRHIEQGAWKNVRPYGTIHRLASDGTVGGVFSRCVAFCKDRIGELRVDTHENNRTMRHLIERHGFVRCGIIHVEDGSPRIAYQYSERDHGLP